MMKNTIERKEEELLIKAARIQAETRKELERLANKERREIKA